MAISELNQAASRAEVGSRATGPTSEAGRKVVSHNAMRHGLSGSGMLLPTEEARAAELNEHALTIEMAPSSALEAMFIKQMAVYQVKAEQAAAMQIEMRAGLAEKSKFFWNDERRLEVLELAEKLGKNPEGVTQKLLLTKQGVQWIVSRWRLLIMTIETVGDWNAEQRSLALDLMGLSETFRQTVPIPFDHADAAIQAKLRRDMAEREIARLEKLVEDYFLTIDGNLQHRAELGMEPLANRELKLLRRYERDARRRFEWAYRQFQEHRKARQQPAPTVTKQTLPDENEPNPAVVRLMLAEMQRQMLEESPGMAEMAQPEVTTHHLKGNRRHRKAQMALERRREKAVRRVAPTDSR